MLAIRLGRTIWWMIGSAAWIAGAQAQVTPTLTSSVAALTFQYQIGSATLPAAQAVQIVSAPAGATFTVAVSGAPFNAAWLLVSASSGKAPLPLKVQVNPTGLPSGSYTGGGPIPDPSLTGIFVLSSNGSPLSATVTVTGATWLKLTPTGNISLAGLFDTITATVNPAGLLPKTYTGTVTIAAPT